MVKLKLYLLNGFYSSLVGAAVEVIAAIIRGNGSIRLLGLFRSMGLGIFIGTTSLFCLFRVLMVFRKRPVFGYIVNFLVIGVSIFICSLAYGGFMFEPASSNWAIALVVAEGLSFILVRIVFSQVIVLNEQLARKKAEIADSGEQKKQL